MEDVSEMFGLVALVTIIGFAIVAVFSVPIAFVVMLGLGIGHTYAHACPAMGYLATYVCLLALSFVAGATLKPGVSATTK